MGLGFDLYQYGMTTRINIKQRQTRKKKVRPLIERDIYKYY